jgi:hypothetical protein
VTSGVHNSNLHLNVALFIFSMPVLIRHLSELKTAVFLHKCLIIHCVLSSSHLERLGYFEWRVELPFKDSQSITDLSHRVTLKSSGRFWNEKLLETLRTMFFVLHDDGSNVEKHCRV